MGDAGGSGGMSGAGGIGGVGSIGACNSADIDAVQMLQVSPRQIAAACADANDVDACIAQGIPGLSAECRSCYEDFVLCLPSACQSACADDACNEVECENCGGYFGCFQALENCSGRDPTDCFDET
jgi:hypothetical protein